MLDPAAGRASNEHLSRLVIAEDDEREGHGDEPPSPLEWVHAQHGVGAGHVSQKGG